MGIKYYDADNPFVFDFSKGLNWVRIKPTYVGIEELNRTIDKLNKDKDLSQIDFTPIFRKMGYFNNVWMIKIKDGRTEIRWVEDFIPHRVVWLENHVIPLSDKEEDSLTGQDAYNRVQELFNDFNGTNILLSSVLSGRKYEKEYRSIKRCVPVQIQWLNKYYKGVVVNGCYKADVSSAFPSQMMKALPTLVGCRRVKGVTEPTEEYPFAFYVESHHIKTLDGYDSHELKSLFYDYYDYNDYVDPKREETILCKAMPSKYADALQKTFTKLYNDRKDNQDDKFYMNAAIGYMHRNNQPMLSFIPAIIILRNNIDMIRRCNIIVKEKSKVIFIATDSICWVGRESSTATTEKKLGSFTYEGEGIKFLGFSPKCYQWQTMDGVTTTKYSGKSKAESAKMKFGQISKEYQNHERKKYVQDKSTGKFYEF